MNILHLYPGNPEETVFGQRIQPAERLQKGDTYNHSGGKWLSIPLEYIGRLASDFKSIIFIRPKR